jgi:YidC/Oxa1 family membrane protein insertase
VSVLAVLDPAVSLAFHAVEALSHVLPTALAVVGFTLLVRVALLPLSRSAARGERARARLAPTVADLQRRHRTDRARLQHELADLYRREGASPLAGCLPRLVQAPFFTVMYRLCTLPAIGAQANFLLDQTLLGVPLGSHLLAVGLGPQLLVLGGVYALIGVVAYLSYQLARRTTAITAASAQPVPGASAMLAKVAPLLSFGTVVVALFLPLAGALYLLASTAWTYGERRLLYPVNAPA